MSKSKKNDIIQRITAVFSIVGILMILIFLQSFKLQIVEQKKWVEMEALGNMPIREIAVEPNRGDICACDNRVLSTSVPYYELRFDPLAVESSVFNKGLDSLSICLSRFFKDNSAAYYKKKILAAKRRKPKPNRYLLINRRKLNYVELQKVKKFPIFRLGQYKGGLQPVMFNERKEPHKDLASRTIGYVSASDSTGRVGTVGLEYAFEKYLRGEYGRATKRISSGSWINVIEEEAEDGLDVITTIDVDFQDIVQNALRKKLIDSDAANGSAILMEVKTGDVKAIANMSRCGEGVYKELHNLAINDAAEPGSVIKAATVICLMEDGFYNAEDTISLGGKGYYMFGRAKMSDSHGKYDKVSLQFMFEHSLNGFAKVVNDCYKTEPQRFVNRWYSMGLNDKLDIVLPGETPPLIKHPKKNKSWSGITLPWMSVGYEVQLSPLQILSFYNAIANDGQRVKPRFVTKLCRRGEVVEEFPVEEVGSKICSKKTLRQIQKMLVGVVDSGTAKNIKIKEFKVAGKTGTARISHGKDGYKGHKASFVGYFPADNPLYSCIVVVNNPRRGSIYGNVVAGGVFEEVANKVYALSYIQHGNPEQKKNDMLPRIKTSYIDDVENVCDELDIDYEEAKDIVDSAVWLSAEDKGNLVKLSERKIPDSSLVPDVVGMGLKDALYILENAGLKVGFSGSGRVVRQSLTANQKFNNGAYIHIELR